MLDKIALINKKPLFSEYAQANKERLKEDLVATEDLQIAT
jgi:hypothetical protein